MGTKLDYWTERLVTLRNLRLNAPEDKELEDDLWDAYSAVLAAEKRRERALSGWETRRRNERKRRA